MTNADFCEAETGRISDGVTQIHNLRNNSHGSAPKTVNKNLT